MCVPYVYFLKQIEVLTLLYTGFNLILHYKHLYFVLNNFIHSQKKKKILFLYFNMFHLLSLLHGLLFIHPHLSTVAVPKNPLSAYFSLPTWKITANIIVVFIITPLFMAITYLPSPNLSSWILYLSWSSTI